MGAPKGPLLLFGNISCRNADGGKFACYTEFQNLIRFADWRVRQAWRQNLNHVTRLGLRLGKTQTSPTPCLKAMSVPNACTGVSGKWITSLRQWIQ